MFIFTQVHTNRSSSLLHKTLLLKRLVSCPAFTSNFVTSHYIEHVTCFYIIYADTHGRSDAHSRMKTRQSWQETRWAVLDQACVNWPIRAGWVFRRRALKRQELKQSVSGRAALWEGRVKHLVVLTSWQILQLTDPEERQLVLNQGKYICVRKQTRVLSVEYPSVHILRLLHQQGSFSFAA